MKALIIAIVCAAAVGGLAACGSGQDTPETAAVATVAATPSGTPQPLRAPEFSLQSADGSTVSLSALLDGREGAALVFYRGFF